MGKRLVVIVDIDTTIANNDHRALLIERYCVVCGCKKMEAEFCPTCLEETEGKATQESWDQFLCPELVVFDKPVKKAQEVISHWRSCGLEFHFITGRNEQLRDVTTQWLKKYFGLDEPKEALVMRPEGLKGLMSASQYKEQAFLQLKKDRNLDDCIFLFCEDDVWVFEMYSKYGMCLRCPEGWEHFMPEGKTGDEPLRNR